MMRTKNRETGIATTTPTLLKKQALLTGELLTDAKVSIGGEFRNEPYVSIEFNSEGARIFDKITAENVGKRLAIVLDNTVYSAPVVKERISGGKASITGGFTMEEAKDLAIVLRAGALPAPVKVVQNITIGPTLGQDSIRQGIRATILGALLVVIFMIIYYRWSGVIACVALFLNLLYLLGAFAGNVMSFLFSDAYSLGASTAIFGLIGAEAVFLYRNRKLLAGQFRSAIGNVLFIIAINLFLVGSLPGIDNWGHIGGLLGGLMFTWFASPLWEIEGIQPMLQLVDKRPAREVVTGAVLVLAVFGALAVWGIVR